MRSDSARSHSARSDSARSHSARSDSANYNSATSDSAKCWDNLDPTYMIILILLTEL